MVQRVTLTEKRARAATPDPKRDLYLRDDKVIGFGLRVKPSGSRSWFVEYRAPDGRNRRLFLGPVEKLRLADVQAEGGTLIKGARSLARDNLALVAGGIDPLEEKRKARRAGTIGEVCADYLAYVRSDCRPSTRREVERVITSEVLPSLGSGRVATTLCEADVRRLHRDLSERGATLANRACQYLRAAYRRARVVIEPDPFEVLKTKRKGGILHREAPRQRLLSAAEVRRLGSVLREAEEQPFEGPKRGADGKFTRGSVGELPSTVLAIRLLLLSGMRKGEVLGLRWDDVDLERGILTIREHKANAEDGVPKELPITAPVKALLVAAHREDGNPFVIAGTVEGRPLEGLPKAWARIRERAGLDDVRLHDLRHGFASAGADAGESLLVIGSLLGHRESRTTERYATPSNDPRAAAAERIARKLAADLEGREDADVVAIS